MEIAKPLSNSYNELLTDIKKINNGRTYINPKNKLLFFSIVTRISGIALAGFAFLNLIASVANLSVGNPITGTIHALLVGAETIAAHELIVIGNNLKKGATWKKIFSIVFGFSSPYDFYLKDTFVAHRITDYCNTLAPKK